MLYVIHIAPYCNSVCALSQFPATLKVNVEIKAYMYVSCTVFRDVLQLQVVEWPMAVAFC